MGLHERPTFYKVNARDREPLLAYMLDALRAEGCRILHEPLPDRAPFQITFETPQGERLGIMAYAFLATFTPTANRPKDEHSFQVKYGTKDGKPHKLWQDPFGLYTTLFLGINLEGGFFVAADPVLHSPTKFFIRIEFKQEHVDQIKARSWFAWERTRRQAGAPVEVLVGGTASSFLRYVRFERETLREDQGIRHLLAERAAVPGSLSALSTPTEPVVHELAREFELPAHTVFDLMQGSRHLKMAVRGAVAEVHLERTLQRVPGVTDCRRLDGTGPDLELRFEGSRLITVECKNVLYEKTAAGRVRLDFQRTRASKKDPCSRYYSARDFDVVAACLHSVSQHWDFQFARSVWLDPHKVCPGKLSQGVRLDERWIQPAAEVLRSVGA